MRSIPGLLGILTLLLSTFTPCNAFTTPSSRSKTTSLHSHNEQHSVTINPAATDNPSRRILLTTLLHTTFLTTLPNSSFAAMKVDKPTTTLAPLTKSEALTRFQAGRDSVSYLLHHYDEICEGGGDNVRRYLGTVGVTSGLFGIGKALKVLGEDVEDIVECECVIILYFIVDC